MNETASSEMGSRALGQHGPVVSEIGLGSWWYGTTDEKELVSTIWRATELGVTMIDTADVYSRGRSEELVGKAIRDRRDEIILATKFGNVLDSQGNFGTVSGRPEYVREACEASLGRLGVEVIDLYYQHRVDTDTPIEETVGAMSELVTQGKVRHIGLSEAGPETIRRAHATHPLAAVQTEYSLLSRDVETDVLPTVMELGVGFVAYSPLARGLLTGAIRNPDQDIGSDDHRRKFPRFEDGNLQRNLSLIDKLSHFAESKGITLAQLALSWILAQANQMVVIFGTKRRRYLEENLKAASISLTAADLAAIDSLVPLGAAAGERYHPGGMTRVGL